MICFIYILKLFLAFVICFFSEKCHAKRYVSSPLFTKTRSHDFHQGWSEKQLKLGPIQPGAKAQSFQIWTLNNGLVTYPGPKLPENVSIGFHAFTNHSGFLECMWTNSKSLVDFVNTSPSVSRFVFMTFDDNAVEIVTWMHKQLDLALKYSSLSEKEQQNFLERSFFVITPVDEIGNWLSSILSDWSCTDHGCGYDQLVFHSKNWNPSIIVSKRLDARYDWVFNHKWSSNNLNLKLVTDSCHPAVLSNINGSVILISDDISTCSIAKKVFNLQASGAAGVLVYSKPGYPVQDLNCEGSDCNNMIKIPVASIPYNAKVFAALASQFVINVSLQTTPSPNFYFTINTRSEVVEPGWFLYPSMQFLAWQMQWLVFDDNLVNRIAELDEHVVPVFNKTVMQGKNGTGYATVHFSDDFDQVFLDMALSCESTRDEGCPPWDHIPQLLVCCKGASLCNVEIGRWITSFRRGIGHWLTDISPLMPLFSSDSQAQCTFLVKMFAWWAQPWVVSLSLRFKNSQPARPVVVSYDQSFVRNTKQKAHEVIALFDGGVFNKTYNAKYRPFNFTVPVEVTSVYIYAVITGHGSDNNGCGEFCVTSHNFVVNGKHKHTKTFSNAGTPLGCADRVPQGVVPNEHGTWLYGRDGWCDGQQVDPWVFEITHELNLKSVNSITYSGLFDGKDPNPTENPGEILMTSYLIYYITVPV